MTDKRDVPRAKAGGGRRDDPLGPNSEIGRKLKQYYSALVTDDVPERFEQLLSKLESVESGQEEG